MSSLLISGQSDYCGHAFKIMASDSMLGEHQTRGPCFPNHHDLSLFSFFKVKSLHSSTVFDYLHLQKISRTAVPVSVIVHKLWGSTYQ